ncbi:MAG TPA: NAD(P)-dependent oxidoreductase [Methylomirabilota bacterium]|nr:NAD(P)-dependent oxidoreductase [Methylomirabilota bacterium]
MQPKIAFLGLGILGSAVAERLLLQGIPLTVWNRTAEKAAPLEKLGAKRAATAQEAVTGADIAITLVLDGAALAELTLGPEGIAQTLARGKIHCDMSTVDLATSRRMAEHYATQGREFISAPVLGNKHAAAAGKLLIFAGGNGPAIDACMPFFSALGEKIWRFEQPPSAIATKLCCNLLLAGMMEVFAEAMLLAEKSGIEQKTFMEIVRASALAAPMFQRKGELIVRKDYEPTFYVRNLLKDLNLALDAAATAGVALPGGRTLRDIYDATARGGFSELDYAAVFEWLAQQGAASSANA